MFIETCTYMFLITYVVATVSFDRSTYIVDETDGLLQAVLVLSDKSPDDITIKVDNFDISTTSKLCTYFKSMYVYECFFTILILKYQFYNSQVSY